MVITDLVDGWERFRMASQESRGRECFFERYLTETESETRVEAETGTDAFAV